MSTAQPTVESEIFSTPEILRQTLERVEAHGQAFQSFLQGPLLFLGSGTSFCTSVAAATLYERLHGSPAQASIAAEYLPRAGWSHLAISRTGQTTELIEAMRQARQAGACVALLCGATDSPAAEQADLVLPLEFAAEQSVIQTRFISASLLALRLLIDPAAHTALAALPAQLEQQLETFDASPYLEHRQVVFLGRSWRYGLALASALNLQETALLAPNGHQTQEYRHGPLAAADEGTLVWCYDAPQEPISAAVLRDVGVSGATVRCVEHDPLISLVQAQLLAVRLAARHGINPDAPRNLRRAIVVPEEAELMGER